MKRTCETAEPVLDTTVQRAALDAEPAIAIRGAWKSFGAVTAVGGADLDVPHGGLTAVLGPSGCGKTTLLRLVAGFERPDTGSIAIGSRMVADARTFVGPEKRRIGMVFQDFALFPHLDVQANVGYALGRRPDLTRVGELLALVGLDGLERRRPHELSGGQQQRVALARALAASPEVVLLDEPFSNLDARLRAQMRRELRRILDASGVSGLLVTHDQDEALSLADRVAIMHAGVVEQVGTPADVYSRPVSRWVAEFLGEINVLPGTASGGVVETELGVLTDRDRHVGTVDVLVRPENLALERGEDDGAGCPAIVVEREYFGHDQVVTVELRAGGRRVRHRCAGGIDWSVGESVRVSSDGPVSVMSPTVRP